MNEKASGDISKLLTELWPRDPINRTVGTQLAEPVLIISAYILYTKDQPQSGEQHRYSRSHQLSDNRMIL